MMSSTSSVPQNKFLAKVPRLLSPSYYKIEIEEDNFEEGLTAALIVAGIQPKHIMTGLDYQNSASPKVFQAV